MDTLRDMRLMRRQTIERACSNALKQNVIEVCKRHLAAVNELNKVSDVMALVVVHPGLAKCVVLLQGN